MRFLLDAHVPLRLSSALSEGGHNVIRAASEFPGWSDDRLLALAVRDKRVIVTEDSDFSELIFGRGHEAPPSVFYLRSEPSELAGQIEQLLKVIETDRFTDHMVVIRLLTVKYRAFPGK